MHSVSSDPCLPEDAPMNCCFLTGSDKKECLREPSGWDALAVSPDRLMKWRGRMCACVWLLQGGLHLHHSRSFYGGSSTTRRMGWRGMMLYKTTDVVAQDPAIPDWRCSSLVAALCCDAASCQMVLSTVAPWLHMHGC